MQALGNVIIVKQKLSSPYTNF